MKKLVTLYALMLFCLQGFAQINYYDSAKVHLSTNIPIALLYADSSLQYAATDLIRAKSHYMIGYIYWLKNEHLKSIESYNQAMDYYSTLDVKQFMHLQLDQGANYELIQSFEQALFYYNRNINLAIQLNDDYQLAKVYRQKARVLKNVNRLDSAILLNLAALKYYVETKNKKYISAIYNAIGQIYLKTNNPLLAIEYFYSAQNEVDLESNNYLRRARTQYNLGRAQLMLGDTTKAIDFIQTAEAMFLKATPEKNYIDLLYDLAPLTNNLIKHYQKAVKYAVANNLTRTPSYRSALAALVVSSPQYFKAYELATNTLIAEKEDALLLHQQQVGNELFRRLTTDALLAKSDEKLWWIRWTGLGLFLMMLAVTGFYLYKFLKVKRIKKNWKEASELVETV